jgi:outer membrane protein TolC
VIRLQMPLLLLAAISILHAQPAKQDSLELHVLALTIEEAQAAAAQTDFWHRLIPRVSLSATFGIREMIFVDPTSTLPYLLPRDAYRLTFTLSISDLLDGSRHARDELQVMQLQTRYAKLLERQQAARELLQAKLHALEEERHLLDEQIRMSQDVIRFREFLFDQGKIHYDVLIRSKMDLLNAQKSLIRLQAAELGLAPELQFEPDQQSEPDPGQQVEPGPDGQPGRGPQQPPDAPAPQQHASIAAPGAKP